MYPSYTAYRREWKQIDPLKPKLVEFMSDSCRGTDNEINYIEHIQVTTTIQFSNRGALQIDLVSPRGRNITITKLKEAKLSN